MALPKHHLIFVIQTNKPRLPLPRAGFFYRLKLVLHCSMAKNSGCYYGSHDNLFRVSHRRTHGKFLYRKANSSTVPLQIDRTFNVLLSSIDISNTVGSTRRLLAERDLFA